MTDAVDNAANYVKAALAAFTSLRFEEIRCARCRQGGRRAFEVTCQGELILTVELDDNGYHVTPDPPARWQPSGKGPHGGLTNDDVDMWVTTMGARCWKGDPDGSRFHVAVLETVIRRALPILDAKGFF